jgi:hypothetical protein
MKRIFTLLISALLLATFSYGADVVVDANISSDVTWSKDNTYILDGFIFVESGATLTIQPGTLVKAYPGETVNASALIISRGAKIMAEGTAADPIIFTALDDDGSMGITVRGQWGGLIVLGKGIHNNPDDNNEIEGVVPDGDNGLYGGSTEDDDSGILKYISIRHGGTELAPDKEINGLTLGACGSKTTISYVEVVANKDDGVEWFGGAPRCDHILVSHCGDDGFDYDEGFLGLNQFMVVIQDPDAGDRCGEHDGGPSSNRYGKPYAHPVFSNATYIGRGEGKGKRIFTMRDFAGGEYHNSIFTNQDKGIDFEYVESGGNAVGSSYTMLLDSGKITVKNNIIWNVAGNDTAKFFLAAAKDTTYTVPADAGSRINAMLSSDNMKADPGVTASAPVPTNDVSGADFTGLDEWFTTVSYKGAFEPGAANWLAGWTLTFPDAVSVAPIRLADARVSVYPNPVMETASVRFENPDGRNFSFRLYSISGQLVRSIDQITSDEFSLQRGALNPGVYTYELRSISARSTGKIILK